MNQAIRAPKNWQDFEELCLRLWREIWNDMNAHKNGRTGQPQSGVDVYGKSSDDGLFHGVQCKGKDTNYGSALTIAEIQDEANKADSFTPEISSFILATTSPRDAKLQEFCRVLSEQKTHHFTVDVWSWDDIEGELNYRPEILQRLGVEYDSSEQEDIEIKISRVSDKERLSAFLSRPIIKETISESVRCVLYKVFYELMQNAFVHGLAKCCMLTYHSNLDSFFVQDNGQEFDPRALLSTEGRGGKTTLIELCDTFESDVLLDYEYKDGLNCFMLSFRNGALSRKINNEKEFFINGPFVVSSKDEIRQRAINDMGKVDPDENVSVVLAGEIPLSCSIPYVEKAAELIGPDRLRVSLPSSYSRFKDMFTKIIPNIKVR